MISILISRMMSIFIKLYSDLFIFCPKKPFLIDHFQFFSKTDVKPRSEGTRLNSSHP